MNSSSLTKLFLSLLPLITVVFAGCTGSPRFASKERATQSFDSTAISPPATAVARGQTEPRENVETRSQVESAIGEKASGRALLTLEGVASYYADEFHGRLTSNGETYDMNGLTAAHRTFPFGTKVRVTNLENNLTVIVRVNDRGPFKEGRIIDLTLGAAKDLEMIRNGTARVKLEVLEWGTGK